jgi:pyroglutamyl-peptidase
MAEMPVIPGAADGHFSTYNEKAILQALSDGGIPAKYSYSAGAYICNFLLFSALDKREKEGADMSIGFIHLPYAEGQREDDMPAMPLEDMVRGLAIVTEHMWN